MKIHKGDNILVISGKDRGRKGKVIRVLPEDERVVVEGINVKKKHMKPRRAKEKGQIIEMPAPFSISNVKIICTKCQKPVKVGYRLAGGKKYRVCKKCGAET